MTEADFTNVNCKPDTWSWGKDGLIKCTGIRWAYSHEEDGDQPRVGGAVAASQARRQQWRFLWAMPESIKNLEAGKGRLPAGIEVQV